MYKDLRLSGESSFSYQNSEPAYPEHSGSPLETLVR